MGSDPPDPLEEEMATHCSILAQKIPWMRTLEDDSPRVVKTQTRLCMYTVAAGEIDCKCRRRAAGLPYTSGLSMQFWPLELGTTMYSGPEQGTHVQFTA